jgi:hypothetical protein
VSVPTIGSLVFVDLTSHDDERVVTEDVNTFGIVTRRVGDRWTVRSARDQREVEFDLQEDRWRPASPGSYILRSTGEAVSTPEYYVHLQRFTSSPAWGIIVGTDHSR